MPIYLKHTYLRTCIHTFIPYIATRQPISLWDMRRLTLERTCTQLVIEHRARVYAIMTREHDSMIAHTSYTSLAFGLWGA